ncbi:hypothetical protein [Rhizobium sp. C1]|uniref:hypothetical protein n=1 Tax=Rhizobium sp. C1 TaxID=1349799 RepID=UPI001E5E22C1|nr:hypothetical protein [Rhizobium sp. C1]MCD2176441.1 hypothetical protein [Rhizobium sp. C1]
MKKPLEVDLDALEERLEKPVVIVEEDGIANKASRIIDEDGDPMDKLPEQAVQNEDGSVTLPLSETVTVTTRKDGKVRDRVYSELVFHRLRGVDLRSINSTSAEMQTVMALARSTRITAPLMSAIYDQMDGADITAAAQVIGHFLTRGQKTRT